MATSSKTDKRAFSRLAMVTLGMAAVVGSTIGCRSADPEPPPPLVPAWLAFSALRIPGTVVTAQLEPASPTTAKAEAAAGPEGDARPGERGYDVRVRMLALEQRPHGFGTALSEGARMVLNLEASDPLLPASRLASDAEIARGDTARDLMAAVERGDWGLYEVCFETAARLEPTPGGSGLLVEMVDAGAPPEPVNASPGSTADGSPETFGAPATTAERAGASRAQPAQGQATALDAPASEESAERDESALGSPFVRAVALHISADLEAEHPIDVGIRRRGVRRVLDPDFDPELEEVEDGAQPPTVELPFRERVVLRDPPRVGEPLALLSSTPFPKGSARAWLVWLEVVPAREEPVELGETPSAEVPLALTDQELAAQAELSSRRARVLDELRQAEHPRVALVYLSFGERDSLTADLALFAEDELIDELLEDAVAALELEFEADEDPLADPRRAWIVERAAYRRLALKMAANDLPAGVDGALLRHTGEAGRYPSTFEPLARASADRATFQRAMAAENTIFLQDRNPAARVRAYDWLASRDSAPEGYDPLASEEQRRAALEAGESEDADEPAEPAESDEQEPPELDAGPDAGAGTDRQGGNS